MELARGWYLWWCRRWWRRSTKRWYLWLWYLCWSWDWWCTWRVGKWRRSWNGAGAGFGAGAGLNCFYLFILGDSNVYSEADKEKEEMNDVGDEYVSEGINLVLTLLKRLEWKAFKINVGLSHDIVRY